MVGSRDGAYMVAANDIPAHQQSADQNQRMWLVERTCLLLVQGAYQILRVLVCSGLHSSIPCATWLPRT